jgi:hypothetical protein
MTPVIVYLVFSLVVFALCCYVVKSDKEDVTVAHAFWFVLFALCPVLNVVTTLAALVYIANKSKFFSKKLF